MDLTPSDSTTAPQQLNLVTSSGSLAGSLLVPSGVSAASRSLDVEYTQNKPSSSSRVGSVVISIVLLDENNQPITQLDEPMIVCLAADSMPDSVPKEDLCLSYYDEVVKEWVCEDDNLVDNGEGQLCGRTPHLTDFALLLGGVRGSDENWNTTMGWLSLGFVIGAIVIVVLSLVVLEIHIRSRTVQRTKRLRTIARLSQQNPTT